MEVVCVCRTVIDKILEYTRNQTNFEKKKINIPTNFGAARQLLGTKEQR